MSCVTSWHASACHVGAHLWAIIAVQTPQPWSYVSGDPYGEYLLMEAATVCPHMNLLRPSSSCCSPSDMGKSHGASLLQMA